MTTSPEDQSPEAGPLPVGKAAGETSEAAALLQTLRRKEGNWVTWGQSCQTLQKAGLSQQQIFEETGFEPVQQNQVSVAAQVYGSLVSGEASPSVLERFEQSGSDSLYALRILTQTERVAAATLLVEKGLDSDGAQDVAKALKEFARLSKSAEFSAYPDDAVAFFYWKLARQQADLQARSRLIAQALRFAKSDSARQAVEKLLTDFSVTRSRPAPRLPFYRFESAADEPRILPVVGKLPLAVADLQATPLVESEGPFRLVRFAGTGAWVALPGWQVILAAEDPVLLLADTIDLPGVESETVEPALLLIDRAERDWADNSYFVVERNAQLALDWFEEPPSEPLLGKLTLVLRPRQVLDEDYNKELWQLDE
ncbi:MAG: RuBisCO accumulation factor 1 [Elainella sp.]